MRLFIFIIFFSVSNISYSLTILDVNSETLFTNNENPDIGEPGACAIIANERNIKLRRTESGFVAEIYRNARAKFDPTGNESNKALAKGFANLYNTVKGYKKQYNSDYDDIKDECLQVNKRFNLTVNYDSHGNYKSSSINGTPTSNLEEYKDDWSKTSLELRDDKMVINNPVYEEKIVLTSNGETYVKRESYRVANPNRKADIALNCKSKKSDYRISILVFIPESICNNTKCKITQDTIYFQNSSASDSTSYQINRITGDGTFSYSDSWSDLTCTKTDNAF